MRIVEEQLRQRDREMSVRHMCNYGGIKGWRDESGGRSEPVRNRHETKKEEDRRRYEVKMMFSFH